MQSLMGGQEQFADRQGQSFDGQGQSFDGQGQSFGGQGLYFWWAGAVMLRDYKVGQFCIVQNFL